MTVTPEIFPWSAWSIPETGRSLISLLVMEEMEEVIGNLDDNVFIQNQEEELAAFRLQINKVLAAFT